MAVKHFDR